MGESYMSARVLHMDIMLDYMPPLTIYRNGRDSTEVTGWKNHHSTYRSAISGALIYERAFRLHHCQVTATITYLPGELNTFTITDSCCWYINNDNIISYFNYN